MQLAKPPQTKLQSGLPIAGLIQAAWSMAEGGGGVTRDAVKNSITAITGSGWAASPLGPGLLGNGTSYGTFIIPETNVTAEGVTLRFLFYPMSWPGAFTAVFDSSGGATRLFFDTSGAPSFGSILGSSYPAGISCPAGQVHDLAITFNLISPFGSRWFLNGKFVGNGGAWTSGGDHTVVLGKNVSGGGGSFDPNIVYLSMEVWWRRISDREISDLYIDPFKLYRLPRRALRASAPAGTAITATGAAVTASAGALLVVEAALLSGVQASASAGTTTEAYDFSSALTGTGATASAGALAIASGSGSRSSLALLGA